MIWSRNMALCLLGAVWATYQPADRPRALLAFEEARRNLASGVVLWSWSDRTLDQPREYRFVSRYALNGDRIFEERGDQEGWVIRDPASDTPITRLPRLSLINGEGIWVHHETNIDCDWWQAGLPDLDSGAPTPNVRDVRWIGMHPSSEAAFQRGVACLWAAGDDASRPIRRWSENERGNQIEVIGEIEGGGTITWWIDPARGWNAERILFRDGDSTLEVRCELRQYAEHWFPGVVTHRIDGKETQRFTVLDAEFCRPDDPLQFSPLDIGLEPGIVVVPQNFRVTSRPFTLYWNGDGVVSAESWFADVRSGRRQPGSGIQRKLRGEESPYLTAEQIREQRELGIQSLAQGLRGRALSDWEKYTLEFIQRYELDQEQSEAANQVLRQCQEEGRRLLAGKQAEFARLARELQETRQAHDRERYARILEQVSQLRAPIERIFESQLKPRLERIPNSEQRRRVAATQPAEKAK